jgi:hypothetical protein
MESVGSSVWFWRAWGESVMFAVFAPGSELGADGVHGVDFDGISTKV